MPPELILLAYGLALLVLSTFGFNRFVLVSLFRKRQHHELKEPLSDADAPTVTIQLPIYNELYVVERLIRSACELDYPRDRLEIQVLDDSTDETLTVARRLVRTWRRRGVDIVHIHRRARTGFKGGALENGLEVAKGEYVAIFDADFVIPSDFLRRAMPHFDAPDVGMVQTRWSYLNDRNSMLTRAAALGLDGHFVVEQSARYWGGLFMNFNGTAGIWRARCIRDAGGWQHDTLTEDLDLSYRAQLAGWRFRYLWDVTCDSEIPADIYGMKAQQFRWTKGSMEAARKLLPRLWCAHLPSWIKVQSTLHLLGNIVFPFFLLAGLLNLPVVIVASRHDLRLLLPLSAYFLFTFTGTFSYYWTAQRAVHLDWKRRVGYFPLFMGASIGLGVYNTQAALEGLFGRKSPFVRTPKYSLTGLERSWRDKHYRSPMTWSTVSEVVLSLYTLFTIGMAIHLGEYGALPFLCLFAFGYSMVAAYSLRHLVVSRKQRVVAAATSGAEGPLRRQALPGFAGVPPNGHRARVPLVAGSAAGHSNGNGQFTVPVNGNGRTPPTGHAVPGAAGGASLAGGSQGPLQLHQVLSGPKPKDRGGNASSTATLVLALALLQGCDSGPRQTAETPERLAELQRVAFPSERPDGFEELALVQKDAALRVVAPEHGRPAGGFWFRPSARTFDWYVWAEGLAPVRAYRVLLAADDRTYAVASFWSTAAGSLRGYGSLESFREGVCVSREDFDPPTRLRGEHDIRVWIQEDGSESAAAAGGSDLLTRGAAEALPCGGNGDGSWDLLLVELAPARFEGV
ncbi:MAG: glycosyltransferase [Gemmatimonadota bacterium]